MNQREIKREEARGYLALAMDYFKNSDEEFLDRIEKVLAIGA